MRQRHVVAVLIVVALAIGAALWRTAPTGDSAVEDSRAAGVAAPGAPTDTARTTAGRAPGRRDDGALVGSVRVFGTDQPVVGVRVTIESQGADLRAATRDDGTFAFASVPKADDWTLTVASDALGEARLAGIAVLSRQTTDVGVVYLAPKFTVPGAVVDDRGRPIGGVTVVVMERTPKQRFDADTMLRDLPRPLTPAQETQAGADGRFRLTGLPPGTYLVYAKKPGYATSVARSVIVAPTATLPVSLVMAEGCRVEGRVVRAGGAAAAGVPVVALSMSDVSSFSETGLPKRVMETTDAEGAFAFDGLGAGKWWFAAAPPGEAVTGCDLVSVPRTTSVEILLDGGASLAGRVTGAGDAPVAGAEVSCGSGKTNANVRTDAEGRYEMRGLAAGTANRFVVRADGYCPIGTGTILDPARRADAAFVLKAGANTRDVKLVAGGTVRGLVVEDGSTTPIPAATVTVLSVASYLDVAPSATTDDAGRFEIAGVPVGAAVLVVRKAGWCQSDPDILVRLEALNPFGADATPIDGASASSGPGLVVANQGDVVERTISMARAVLLHGRVVGPSGDPVAGARVDVDSVSAAGHYFGPNLARMAFGTGDLSRLTDAEGRFEIAVPVAAGKVHLKATAPGFRSADKYDIEIGGASPPPDVELRLSVGATIEGRVTDSSGAPVEGAAVSWRRTSGAAEDFLQSLIDYFEMGDDHGRTTTGADGTYRLALVNTIGVTLDVRDGRHVSVRRDGLDVRDGKTLRVDVTLESGLSITGRVSRIDGRQPASAWVEVHREGDEAGKNDASGDESMTSPDGTFRVGALAAGNYRLVGHAHGASDSAPAVVSAGAEGVELRLAAQMSIAGAVKFRDGRPAVGAKLTATGSAGGKPREARTGDDGAFRIEGLDPGEYEISATAGPAVTDSEFRAQGVGDVAAGEADVTIEVEPGMTISGEVLAPDGAPAASGFVHCVAASAADAAPERQSEATIRSGRFVLKGLTTGKYVVSVALTGFSAQPCTADAGATDVKLRLMKCGAIKGRVLLADGKPARYADLQVEDDGVAPASAPSDTADGDGKFTLRNVPAGPHRVTAKSSDDDVHYAGEIRDVRVVEGRTTEGVEIHLTKRE